jgi:hypothetical protein
VAAVKTRLSREEEPKAQLSGVRAEFRLALEAEIEAAIRSAASSAVPLVNGRRLDGLASSFQYIFSAVSILNVPSDSPAELLIDRSWAGSWNAGGCDRRGAPSRQANFPHTSWPRV